MKDIPIIEGHRYITGMGRRLWVLEKKPYHRGHRVVWSETCTAPSAEQWDDEVKAGRVGKVACSTFERWVFADVTDEANIDVLAGVSRRGHIMLLLERDGNLTAREIAAELGLPLLSMKCRIEEARRRGLLRIADWQFEGGFWLACYGLGPGPDKKRPAKRPKDNKSSLVVVLRKRAKAGRAAPGWLAGLI